MGKRIKSQRRGRGSLTYRSPSFNHRRVVNYNQLKKLTQDRLQITDIVHAPGRGVPLLVVDKKYNLIAPEGAYTGQRINFDPGVRDNSQINILNLDEYPFGTIVCNIEKTPGGGGMYVRGSGTFGIIKNKVGTNVHVLMPSKALKKFNKGCLAVEGRVANSKKSDLPLLKAGNKFFKLKNKAKKHVTVRGVAMNPVSHPHGGGNHPHVGKPSCVSYSTPPGRKVGNFGAKKKKK